MMQVRRVLSGVRRRVVNAGLPDVSYTKIDEDAIKRLVTTETPTILEIGCNDGTHTSWFLEMFERPEIYCFEPDPRAVARFRDRLGDRDEVHLFEVAISDRGGTTTFHQSGGRRGTVDDALMPEGWDQSGSIRPPKKVLGAYPWLSFDERIEVPTSRLDTWRRTQGIERIDFIWMDVQGAEMDVFGGGSETLARTKVLYTEYSNQEMYEGQSPLRRILRELTDFRVVTRFPGDVLLRNIRTSGPPG